MTRRIELAEMYVDDEIRRAVMAVLDSGRYIKGPEAEAFETEFAAHHGARVGVAVSNGTTALHLAYHALGVGPGDEVLVPSHTYIASITPALHLGATPVWVEVDEATMTMDVADLARKITPRSKVVTAVHLYGHPADMDAIGEVARANGLRVVEDCAQAHDAEYKGAKVGALGDVSTFSFFPSKNMTVAGDGGMVLTNDAALGHTIGMLRDQGREPSKKYENDLVGFNFRLSEMLAAVGRVQLRRLPAWTTRRREVAARYAKELTGLPGVVPPTEAPWARHVYHQYVVRTPRRAAFMEHLKRDGVASGIHYPVPTHRQPGIAKRFPPRAMPLTERLADEVTSLPVHQGLSDEDVSRVVASVRAFAGRSA